MPFFKHYFVNQINQGHPLTNEYHLNLCQLVILDPEKKDLL